MAGMIGFDPAEMQTRTPWQRRKTDSVFAPGGIPGAPASYVPPRAQLGPVDTLTAGAPPTQLMEQATGVNMNPFAQLTQPSEPGVRIVYPPRGMTTTAAAPAASAATGLPRVGTIDNPRQAGLSYTVPSVAEVATSAANTIAAPKIADTKAPAEQAWVGTMGGGEADQMRERAMRKISMGGLGGLVVGRQMLAAARGMEQGAAARDALQLQQQQLGMQQQQLAQTRNIEQARLEQGATGMQVQQQTAREQIAQRATEAEQAHFDRLTQNELQKFLAGQKNTLDAIIADKVARGDLAGVRAIQEAMSPKQAKTPDSKVITDPIKGTSSLAIIGPDGVPIFARVPGEGELQEQEKIARQRGMP